MPDTTRYLTGVGIPMEFTVRNNGVFPIIAFDYICEIYSGNTLIQTKTYRFDNESYPILPNTSREISTYDYITGLTARVYSVRSRIEVVKPPNTESDYSNNS